MAGRTHKVLLSLALALLGASAATAPLQVDRLSVLRAADEAGFAVANTPRRFEFPQDHGPHPQFRHEWWYFTGQLRGAGETFGFELTVFRLALRPPQSTTSSGTEFSAWRARQVYAAHFAITDVSRRSFFSATRYARDALNLAGAQASPFAIHVADWSVIEAPGAPPAEFALAAAGRGWGLPVTAGPARRAATRVERRGGLESQGRRARRGQLLLLDAAFAGRRRC